MAQSAIAPTDEGSPLLADCVASDDCGGYLATQLSENLVEAGFALAASPIGASTLGGKGTGVVAELHVDSLPLGERNELGQELALPPALPTLAVAYHVGSNTYDDPGPQLAVGAHVLPPVRFGDTSAFAAGVAASAAWPVVRQLWLGAEATYTYGRVTAPLVGPPDDLRDIDAIRPYIRGIDLDCDPCLDTTQQHGPTLRLGVSFEPVPAWFVYGRGGVWVVAQTLDLDVDDSRWQLAGILPTTGVGTGLRLADRMQLSAGLEHAVKSATVSTEGRAMFKVIGAMSVRIGGPCSWEDAARG